MSLLTCDLPKSDIVQGDEAYHHFWRIGGARLRDTKSKARNFTQTADAACVACSSFADDKKVNSLVVSVTSSSTDSMTRLAGYPVRLLAP